MVPSECKRKLKCSIMRRFKENMEERQVVRLCLCEVVRSCGMQICSYGFHIEWKCVNACFVCIRFLPHDVFLSVLFFCTLVVTKLHIFLTR